MTLSVYHPEVNIFTDVKKYPSLSKKKCKDEQRAQQTNLKVFLGLASLIQKSNVLKHVQSNVLNELEFYIHVKVRR